MEPGRANTAEEGNDLDRELVMADIKDWLIARLPAA